MGVKERASEREEGEERMGRIEVWSQVHPRGGHSACGFYVEIESLTAFVFWKIFTRLAKFDMKWKRRGKNEKKKNEVEWKTEEMEIYSSGDETGFFKRRFEFLRIFLCTFIRRHLFLL